MLPGFNPDPSVCRVGDDYYLVTSSFVWFPGIPVYHSKDLVNWELIGHGITRSSQADFTGLKDKDGIWAVTIRHHDGLFYLITTCSGCGGNFYITAKDPAGPWSDPVWLKDAPGIDPSLFWDTDGKCYYTGNTWDFKKSWPGQCAIWGQELDLSQKKLVGERKILTYGHANNASYTESPHLYKIKDKYLLLTAEGGTDTYHSVTAHHSETVMGTYTSDKINPVLSHRQLGKEYPIQAVGHADIVQTQNGDWWGVALGKRLVGKETPLSRETFLCKVAFEEGTPVFNPGYGRVLNEQERPNLSWTPVKPVLGRDDFEGKVLGLKWYFIRTPKENNYEFSKGSLMLKLKPETADSLVSPSLIIQKIKHHNFSAITKLNFSTKKGNEQAGIILYRNSESYYMLLKEKAGIVLIKKDNGKKEIVAKMPHTGSDVYLGVVADGLKLSFSAGSSENSMQPVGGVQDINVLSDSPVNKFNGTGVGMYATANSAKSSNGAAFDWFEYKTL
ncbi:glycoside hydrolase family 43 protein [Flavobacterium sp. Sd200]|uniref:glycoside hydrolase family 43 protein n=1 Tax=Flavobacterium sp. Sd200 TaxID=2692211 RepID=UPI0019276D19